MREWVCALSADVSPCSVSCLLTVEFSFYRLHYERVSLCTECWCVSLLSVLSVDCGILFLQTALWESEFVHWVLMCLTAQCLVCWLWNSLSTGRTMRVWVCALSADVSHCSVSCLLAMIFLLCRQHHESVSLHTAHWCVFLLSVLPVDASPCSVYCLLICLFAQCTACWYVSLLSVFLTDVSSCSVYFLLICLPAQCIAYWCVSLLSVLPTDAFPCSVYCLLMRLPGPCLAHWHVSLLSVLHTDVSPCSMYCLLMHLPAQCTGFWYIYISLDMYP